MYILKNKMKPKRKREREREREILTRYLYSSYTVMLVYVVTPSYLEHWLIVEVHAPDL